MNRILIACCWALTTSLRESLGRQGVDVVNVEEHVRLPNKKIASYAPEPLPRYYHESFRKGKGEKKRAASARQSKGWR